LPPPSRFADRLLTEEIRGEIPLGKTTRRRRRTWFVTGLFLMLVVPLYGGHGEAVLLIRLMAEQARVEASQVGLLPARATSSLQGLRKAEQAKKISPTAEFLVW
jgi:hypothetical protein